MGISMDFPAVIAVIVTLPLDQILKSIVPHLTVKELFDCVLVLAINECWWRWGGRSATWNGVWKGGGQLDDWEYRVEVSKAEWVIETVGSETDTSLNRKGAQVAVGQFH
jgi:hypothetical protein